MAASRYDVPVGVLAGVDSLGLGIGEPLGDGAADVGTVVGVGLGDGVRVGVAVGRVLLGAGAGSLWVQATGPTIHAATNRAVMTGRRILLLGLAVPPPTSGVARAAERPGLG